MKEVMISFFEFAASIGVFVGGFLFIMMGMEGVFYAIPLFAIGGFMFIKAIDGISMRGTKYGGHDLYARNKTRR